MLALATVAVPICSPGRRDRKRGAKVETDWLFLVSTTGVGLLLAVFGLSVSFWIRRSDRVMDRQLRDLQDAEARYVQVRRTLPDGTVIFARRLRSEADEALESAADGDSSTLRAQPLTEPDGSRPDSFDLGSPPATDTGESVENTDSYWTLLNAYYAQGLGQSRISFSMSLIAASLGFALIIVTVVLSYFRVASIDAVAVGLIAGTITEAVAALFFVQSNKSRSLMQDMHARLRKDDRVNRQYFKALELIREIKDPAVQDDLRAQFARHFVKLEQPGRSSDRVDQSKNSAARRKPDEEKASRGARIAQDEGAGGGR